MLLIKNGTVYTQDEKGILENTDILCDNGKIVKIGQNLSADCEVIDASGLNVIPGIVDAHSHIGGFGDEDPSDQDLNEITSPVTAELDAKYAINLASKSFDRVIKTGVTCSGIAPGSANVVCGYVCAVKSKGKERIIKDPIALKAAMGLNPKGCYGSKNLKPMSRLGIAQVMREYFLNVQEYMNKKAEAGDDKSKLPPYNLAYEHGIPVLKKEIPLKVHSYQHDMLTVLDIAKEFDFNVTLDHALGASDFYDDIAVERVKGVIFGPMGGSPQAAGELCKCDIYSLCELDRRGILTAVMTDGPIASCQMLIDQIGEVVRFGSEYPRALAMITSNAAKIMGVDDRIGSITVGKDADFAIYQGRPGLDVYANNKMTIINGEVVYKN